MVLWVTGTLYCGLALRIFLASLSQTGTFTFPLDDTYIAMALAKNLALHGVMGISATRFASATSCPGFLLLLAGAYRITGPNIWWPLIFSLGFGLLTLFVAQRLLANTHWTIQLVTLLAALCFTPLHVMGLLGMEHSLHLMLVLAFLSVAAEVLAEQRPPTWGLLILASLLVSVRYESLFIIAVTCLLFLREKKVAAALRLGAAAVVPVALYAAVAVHFDSYWLPQSIAIKGFSADTGIEAPILLFLRFKQGLMQAPYMGALLGVIIMLLAMRNVRANTRIRSMLEMVFGGILLHLSFAGVGWVYRYEAYLIGAAIVVIGCALPYVRISRNRLATLGALAFGAAGVWLLAVRTLDAEKTFPLRSAAVYYQQIQMARFLSRFETKVSVAANDVGAINYFADIDCLDLVGLGDREVFWAKRQGLYSTSMLAKIASDRGVKVAVVYDTWFRGLGPYPFGGPSLPSSWIRVARWKTPFGQYLGGDTVSFYATNPAEAARLKSTLTAFAPSLPRDVRVLDD